MDDRFYCVACRKEIPEEDEEAILIHIFWYDVILCGEHHHALREEGAFEEPTRIGVMRMINKVCVSPVFVSAFNSLIDKSSDLRWMKLLTTFEYENRVDELAVEIRSREFLQAEAFYYGYMNL